MKLKLENINAGNRNEKIATLYEGNTDLAIGFVTGVHKGQTPQIKWETGTPAAHKIAEPLILKMIQSENNL